MNEILVTNKKKIEPKHIAFHQPYEYDRYEMTGSASGNQCTVMIYDMPPGKANYPYHYHTANEEVFYIISGRGVLETPTGEIEVESGDVVVFPPSEQGAHRLRNASETEMLTYLDVDVNHSADVVFYPRSNKVGVFTRDGYRKIFKQDGDVGYYEGE